MTSRSVMLSGVPSSAMQLEEQRADLGFGARPVGVGERLEVQAVEQLAVDVGLQLEVLRPRRLDARVRAGAAAAAAEVTDS